MPPCFLYLSNAWSIAVLLPRFSSVFAWQSKLLWEDLPTRQLFCVLAPIPSLKPPHHPRQQFKWGTCFWALQKYIPERKQVAQLVLLWSTWGQKKQNRALRQVVSQGSPNRELMYGKAQSLGITMVVGWGVPRDTMVTELKSYHYTALARTQSTGTWGMGMWTEVP